MTDIKVVADTDWISALCMSILLIVAAAFAFHDWKLLAWGIVEQPVSFYTVLLSVYALWFGFTIRKVVFREAAFMIGVGAAFRSAAFYLHASVGAQRLASINQLLLSLFAFVMILVGTIDWFRRVFHIQKSSEDEQ